MIEPYNVKHFHSLAKIREPARKLCEYLLAAGACDETAVMYALDRQENLRAKGYDPLIGMLLLDAGAITKKDLADVEGARARLTARIICRSQDKRIEGLTLWNLGSPVSSGYPGAV